MVKGGETIMNAKYEITGIAHEKYPFLHWYLLMVYISFRAVGTATTIPKPERESHSRYPTKIRCQSPAIPTIPGYAACLRAAMHPAVSENPAAWDGPVYRHRQR